MRTAKSPQETIALEIYDQYKDYLVIFHDYLCLLYHGKPSQYQTLPLIPNLLASLLSISKGFPVFKPIDERNNIRYDGLMPVAKMIEHIIKSKETHIEYIKILANLKPTFTPYLSEVISSFDAICEHKELLMAEFKSKLNFNSQTGYPGLIRAEDIPCFQKFLHFYDQKRGWGIFTSSEGMILLIKSGKIFTLNEVIIYAKSNPKSRSHDILENDLNINVKEASVVLDKSEVTKELDKLKLLVPDLNKIVVSYLR